MEGMHKVKISSKHIEQLDEHILLSSVNSIFKDGLNNLINQIN